MYLLVSDFFHMLINLVLILGIDYRKNEFPLQNVTTQ